jgi:dTDP-glucose 4,6-dehydratase
MNKKILITGGSGFISHNVISYFLRNSDYSIIALNRSNTPSRLCNIDRELNLSNVTSKKRVKTVFHDLKNEMDTIIRDEIGDVNFIIHIAASSSVVRSFERPLEYIFDNVIGTANLLEYARTLKHLEKFIYFSSVEVFGPSLKGTSFPEWSRYNSCNPYAASKASGEEFCVAYENTYKLPIYITHTTNVYGCKQGDDKFIPMLIKKIFHNEKVKILYDSKSNLIGVRTYIHVDDIADCLLFIINANSFDKNSDPLAGNCFKFNITSKDELNNLEVAKLIAKIMNKRLNYELVDGDLIRPGHDLKYSMSGDYLASLGWSAKTSLEAGLKNVISNSIINFK